MAPLIKINTKKNSVQANKQIQRNLFSAKHIQVTTEAIAINQFSLLHIKLERKQIKCVNVSNGYLFTHKIIVIMCDASLISGVG